MQKSELTEYLVFVETKNQLIWADRVYPCHVADVLNRHERTVRRYMSQLAEQGKLKRHGQRRGYTLH